MSGKNRSQIFINILLAVSILGILFARFSGINNYKPGGQVNIGIKDYGERWPFKIEEVILACPSSSRVILHDSGIYTNKKEIYALSQAALDFGGGWVPYQALLRPDASDEVISEILQRGLKLCPPPRR